MRCAGTAPYQRRGISPTGFVEGAALAVLPGPSFSGKPELVVWVGGLGIDSPSHKKCLKMEDPSFCLEGKRKANHPFGSIRQDKVLEASSFTRLPWLDSRLISPPADFPRQLEAN